MKFEEFLAEDASSSSAAHEHCTSCGIKLKHDADTGEHSATVPKDREGLMKVARLHTALADHGWKHKEHPSGHVYSNGRHTITVYHKCHGPEGNDHHEIVLGKH